MNETQSSIFGLKHQSRCLEAVPTGEDDDRHIFLIGGADLREGKGGAQGVNELTFVEYVEADRRIETLLSVGPGKDGWEGREVLDLCPSPYSAGSLFALTQQPDGSAQAELWAFDLEGKQEDQGYRMHLSGHQGSLQRLLWDPSKEQRVLGLGTAGLSVWEDFAQGGPRELSWALSPEPELGAPARGAWDPHHANLVVSSNQCSLRAWDLRSQEHSFEIAEAHLQPVSDVDFNPNRPFYVATAGRDRRVCIWDIRKAQQPIVVVAGHSHWVESVRYNRFHDQLLLSAGTDQSVHLWSLVSASSAPLSGLESENSDTKDHLVATYDEHDDSVYAVRWSCSDAWIFASLSFDGRLVVSQVPKAQQYSILL